MKRLRPLERLRGLCPLTFIIATLATLALSLGASRASAQVQNLCLQEIDGVVSPDSYGDISTEEACSLDRSGGTGNNNSWGDLISAGPPSVPNPTSGTGSGGTFTGHHTNGDLFLLSAFTQGGGQIGIQAFKWQCTGTGKACDDSGSLVNVANGACSGAGFGSQSNFLCGEVNDHTITVPSQLPN